jgi:hypothetical protein
MPSIAASARPWRLARASQRLGDWLDEYEPTSRSGSDHRADYALDQIVPSKVDDGHTDNTGHRFIRHPLPHDLETAMLVSRAGSARPIHRNELLGSTRTELEDLHAAVYVISVTASVPIRQAAADPQCSVPKIRSLSVMGTVPSSWPTAGSSVAAHTGR